MTAQRQQGFHSVINNSCLFLVKPILLFCVMEDPIVIAGIGARLPGRRAWCEEVDEGIDAKARWPRGIHGIQQVLKMLLI